MISAKTAITIATHKHYNFPKDPGYMPIHVGKAISSLNLGILGDDTGDNISRLNPYFCELTAIYWMWKNVAADFYGLAHYRRYFCPVRNDSAIRINKKPVASSQGLIHLLNSADIILAKKRNYWVETIQSHYGNAHYPEDLAALRDEISRRYPEYLAAFDKVHKGRTLSLYNMFVMRADHFSSYCTWLFPLLFSLTNKIDYINYGPYQRRVFGFLAERLLNVWVERNIHQERVRYLKVVNLEGERLLSKATNLLSRKFYGERAP